MAVVRLFNPVVLNPKRGTWTEYQASVKKSQAETFERNVLKDDDAGDDFADMTIEEFAERHHKHIVRNPKPQRSVRNMKTINRRKSANGGNGIRGNQSSYGMRRNQPTSSRLTEDLLDEIDELKAAKKKLQSQVDEISDLVECDDCTAEEHLDQIEAVLDGTGNGDDDD